ncbi:MAG: hypothetical protein C5B58_11515 [Acidobacteria bacterium]|nr:MAG: hypothetical protein C5B58_11515 [Acidobacteriota bacterium]
MAKCRVDLASSSGPLRVKFDRVRQLRVQPQIFDEDDVNERRINIHLTDLLVRASLRDLFH